jgi:hypothetical protein
MSLAIAVDIALAIVYRTSCVVDIRSDSPWISRRTRYRVTIAVDIVLVGKPGKMDAAIVLIGFMRV